MKKLEPEQEARLPNHVKEFRLFVRKYFGNKYFEKNEALRNEDK